MQKSAYQTSKIFDIDVFSNRYSDVLNILEAQLEAKKSLFLVMTPNPEQIVLSRKNKTFLDHLRSADLLLPDGIGLVLASKVLNQGNPESWIKERISGREVAYDLLALAGREKLSVLIVGGKNYLSSQYTEGSILSIKDIKLDDVYWTQGYADIKDQQSEEERALLALIKTRRPKIIFVAFGAPYQESWVIEHKAELEKAGVHIVMVVGGAFDVLLGNIPAAPNWMQQLGLEWLFRLYQEPWRWRRQLQLLVYLKLVVQTWLKS